MMNSSDMTCSLLYLHKRCSTARCLHGSVHEFDVFVHWLQVVAVMTDLLAPPPPLIGSPYLPPPLQCTAPGETREVPKHLVAKQSFVFIEM